MSDGLFVDASALCAILLDEPEREAFKKRIVASRASTSPLASFEAVLALRARRGLSFDQSQREVDDFVAAAQLALIDITPEIGRIAVEARARYGKGSGHPARLNMGDCFAYACAKAQGVALLYKGDDFVHTDLA